MMKNALLHLFMIVSGCVFYGWSMVYLAAIPTIPGNLMGIAVVCHALFGWPAGFVNIVLSIPTLILGTLILGKRMLLYTLIAMAGISGVTDLFIHLFPYEANSSYLVLTVISAAIMGIGCGLILYAGGTTGGTTVLARLLNRKFPRITLGNLLIIMDGMILVGGALALHDVSSLCYSIIFEVICCKAIDIVCSLLSKLTPAS